MTNVTDDVNLNISFNNFSESRKWTGGSDVPATWGFLVRQSVGHVIVVVGLVGNCLTMVVMKSKPLRFKSYSHYLCALAVFDSIVLLTREVRHVDDLKRYLGVPGVFSDFTSTSCRLFLFTETLSCLVSAWLVVAMATERLLVVYRPFGKSVLCTQKGAIVVIVSIVVIFSYTQVFRLVMVRWEGGECLSVRQYADVYIVLHVYLYQVTLTFLLPVGAVFVCNISVLCKIRQVERQLQEDDDSASTRLNHASTRNGSKTTRLLLTIGFVFVFTLLPSSTLSLILLTAYKLRGLAARPLLLASYPWSQVLAAVTDVNYAANFYIYVLSGRPFRRELRRVLHTEGLWFYASYRISTRATREEFVLT
ncbi:hypothetical protein ACOMHN_009672 [Nucella lapillus]